MSLEQKQLPTSSGDFTNDNRTDGPADYSVTRNWYITHAGWWHICTLPVYYRACGVTNPTIPLWRMNGAGPNDSKIPVILAYGFFSCRYGMDYGIDGEKYSLARFLANRGRDVWIIELPQTLEDSSADWIANMNTKDLPWKTWYKELMFTQDGPTYTALQAYFDALDPCSGQNAIVDEDCIFTETVDDCVIMELPAIISAILHITGQPQAQWVGHSIGATIMFGFMPTQFTTIGKTNAGYIEGDGWHDLPANSILSLTALCSPTALIDCPDWLMTMHTSGQFDLAWKHRGKLPRYFTYDSLPAPKWPVKLQGVMDCALLKQLDLAIVYKYFSFFNTTANPQLYYHQLYEGQTLLYPYTAVPQMTITGHTVAIPTTCMFDGNGYDTIATKSNVHFIPDKMTGYKCFKPFFQYSHAFTAHSEMINGYNVEGGDPAWPKDLNYTFKGTYHYIWYDLNRYLPPATFNAYITDISCSGDPLISWQNLRDSVSFEIWARQGNGSFIKKVADVNSATSAIHCTGLSSGVWQIKVRAISLGGSWLDHSGLSSIGGVDDPALYLSVIKT